MGTNFYFRFNACEHCNRYDEVHLGKRSAGWSFGFHALEHRLISDEHRDWGYTVESPFGYPVLSRADWLRVLAEVPGRMVNEYGEEIADPVGWVAELEPPDVLQRLQEEEMTSYPSYYEHKGWRDAEGFRFEPREFS